MKTLVPVTQMDRLIMKELCQTTRFVLEKIVEYGFSIIDIKIKGKESRDPHSWCIYVLTTRDTYSGTRKHTLSA